jgi:hypothetical protein
MAGLGALPDYVVAESEKLSAEEKVFFFDGDDEHSSSHWRVACVSWRCSHNYIAKRRFASGVKECPRRYWVGAPGPTRAGAHPRLC